MNELTRGSAVRHLRRVGLLSPGADPDCRWLGGGVSNRVLAVRWADTCVVVKQPLANLAVDDDWPADRQRVHNEAVAMRAYAKILEHTGVTGVAVPEVLDESHEDHLLVMACAPEQTGPWKDALLDGDVDVSVAERLGEVLSTVHTTASADESLRQQFPDDRPFEQLRIEPYHRTTARRHPDVAEFITAEIDRISAVRQTLVHGDFSPKNVLVHDDAGTPPVWLIDFEVAHWGDPAFDTAFLLNHLFIKAVFNHTCSASYIDAAMRFYDTYRSNVPWDIEPATARELAVLMLARIDGKSPVEYITDARIASTLRELAKHALKADIADVETYASSVKEVADTL